MTDSISRFWDKYITTIADNKVPEGARRWYVRHLEIYINTRNGRRLATTTREDVEVYIDEIGRKENMTAWQYRQVVDSLCILFSEIVKVSWFDELDWQQMMDDARDLPEHRTPMS
jgi:hypothetical protein